MNTVRNKVLEIVNQTNEKVQNYLEYIQSEIEALTTDFRKLVDKYGLSGLEAFAFIASSGVFDRSDLWIEFIKGLLFLVLSLIFIILMYVPTLIVFWICKCLMRNIINRINQLSFEESIAINLLRLFLLICCVLCSVILYYTFFLFYYLPCKYFLTKGTAKFFNIFNMNIPFA